MPHNSVFQHRYVSFTRSGGHRSKGGYGVDHGRREEAEAAAQDLHDDFKAGAVRLVLDEGKTVSQVARDLDLDLTASALRTWVERARADRSQGKTGLTREERLELSSLRKEVRALRMQRDILKKLVMRQRRTREWMKTGTVTDRGAGAKVVA